MKKVTIKTTENNGKIVRGGEAVQLAEFWANQVEKGDEIEVNGVVRVIRKFGTRFKIGRVAYYYAYVTENFPCEYVETVAQDGGQSELRNAII
jgi:hypothetical protein